MADMLVNLLKLPDDKPDIERLRQEGIIVRRIMAHEQSILRRYVLETFGEAWADEIGVTFSRQPISCFIAIHDKKIVGFGAYECTRRDFFGPTGVSPAHRGKGIGRVLLLVCLRAMQEMGYAYAIIGGVGPSDFYTKCVGAQPIPDSTPGIYADPIERGSGQGST